MKALPMRAITVGGIATLSLLLGITAPALAGQEHGGEKQAQSKPQQSTHEQARPEQQHAQPQHVQQAPRQVQSRPQQNDQQQQRSAQSRGTRQRSQQQPSRQAQSKPQQQSRGGQNSQPQQRTQDQHRAQQSAWQQHRAGNWQTDHRTWQQRGGYNGYRIPDDRFRVSFGEGHGFRIGTLPFLMIGGFPRFQYGGYWFSVVDPWPAYWGDNWYDNDDVYVSYVDNGYYLYNRRYPGIGLAISISF
jgi:hypothetical protein